MFLGLNNDLSPLFFSCFMGHYHLQLVCVASAAADFHLLSSPSSPPWYSYFHCCRLSAVVVIAPTNVNKSVSLLPKEKKDMRSLINSASIFLKITWQRLRTDAKKSTVLDRIKALVRT